MAEYYRINRTQQKLTQANVRLQLWSREREKGFAEKVVVNEQKDRLNREKQKQLVRQRQIASLRLLHRSVLKQMRSKEKKEQDLEILKQAHEAYVRIP